MVKEKKASAYISI